MRERVFSGELRALLRIRRCYFALLCGVLLVTLTASFADTAYLIGKDPVTGQFAGYDKGFFLLENAEGKTYRIRDKRVQRLMIDDPPRMILSVKGSHKEPEVLVKGYNLPLIEFVREGRVEKHNLNRINWIKKLSEVGWVESFKESGTVISRGEAVNIGSFVKPGKATAVHFHRADSPQSVKMQAYLSRIYHMDKGGVEYLRVEPRAPDSPVMRQCKVRAFPEIWIYDRNGELLVRLTDEVTPREIDDALERAQHPGSD